MTLIGQNSWQQAELLLELMPLVAEEPGFPEGWGSKVFPSR